MLFIGITLTKGNWAAGVDWIIFQLVYWTDSDTASHEAFLVNCKLGHRDAIEQIKQMVRVSWRFHRLNPELNQPSSSIESWPGEHKKFYLFPSPLPPPWPYRALAWHSGSDSVEWIVSSSNVHNTYVDGLWFIVLVPGPVHVTDQRPVCCAVQCWCWFSSGIARSDFTINIGLVWPQTQARHRPYGVPSAVTGIRRKYPTIWRQSSGTAGSTALDGMVVVGLSSWLDAVVAGKV